MVPSKAKRYAIVLRRTLDQVSAENEYNDRRKYTFKGKRVDAHAEAKRAEVALRQAVMGLERVGGMPEGFKPVVADLGDKEVIVEPDVNESVLVRRFRKKILKRAHKNG
jgi:hypothetical protein